MHIYITCNRLPGCALVTAIRDSWLVSPGTTYKKILEVEHLLLMLTFSRLGLILLRRTGSQGLEGLPPSPQRFSSTWSRIPQKKLAAHQRKKLEPSPCASSSSMMIFSHQSKLLMLFSSSHSSSCTCCRILIRETWASPSVAWRLCSSQFEKRAPPVDSLTSSLTSG